MTAWISAHTLYALTLTGLLAVAGCQTQENTPPRSIGTEASPAPGDSVSVTVRPLTDLVRSRVALSFQGALDGIRFDPEASHSLFAANARYLVWVKSFTDTLCVYDLRTREMARKLRIPRGRGPGEFEELQGAAITSEGVIYLAEPNQAKLLRFHVTKGPLDDFTFRWGPGFRLGEANRRDPEQASRKQGLRPGRIDAVGLHLVAQGVGATGFIGMIDGNGVFREATGFDSRAEFGNNLFIGKAGRLDATRQRAFFLTRFQPRIYVFDVERNRFIKTITYADADVELPGPQKTEDGGLIFLPPQEVRVLGRNVVAVPGQPDRVLIQAEGSDGQHMFDPSALYEVDVPSGTVVAEHDLGLNIDKVASAGRRFYVFDDEKRQVFAYRFQDLEQ